MFDDAPWLIRKLKDDYWGKVRPLDVATRIFRMQSESGVRNIVSEMYGGDNEERKKAREDYEF